MATTRASGPTGPRRTSTPARREEGRDGRRDQEGLPQAGARQPPRLQPRRRRQAREVQGGRRGLRRRRRRREAQEVRRDARRSTARAASGWRRRRRSGGGGGVQPRRPAAATAAAPAAAVGGGSATCSATSSAASAAAAPRPQPRPQKGADVETDRDDRLHRRHRRRHDLAAADLRRAVPRLQRHRRQARHHAAHLPGAARAPASWSTPSAAARSRSTRPAPSAAAAQLVYDEPVPDLPRQRPRPVARARIQARIPAGVKDGQRIRLRGKGAAGEHGGPAGDLYVTVKVSPHRLFGRKGDNLTLDVPISFDEAALGAEIKIPTLGGSPVTLKVPAGTPNGRTFRVRGKGVAHEGRHHGRPARHRPGPGARARSTPRRGRPSRPTAPRPATSRPARRTCSSEAGDADERPAQPSFERAGDPDARRLRDQRRRRADRPAPADAAHLRADGPDHARPHRRRRSPLLGARHRPAPRDRRPDLVRHRHRGRAPDPRAREPRRRPLGAQRGAARRARGHPRGAASGGLGPPQQPSSTRLPAVRQQQSNQSIVVWRRGRCRHRRPTTRRRPT